MRKYRKGNKIVGFIAVAIILVVTGCAKLNPEKPNVVFILVDQWRGSATGYAGDPNVKTPNLDKFSEDAVTFKNAVSVCPVCTPYRASLLTGRYPTSTGMFLNDAYLPPEEVTLAEVFKENDYDTGYIGKWHLDGQGRFDFTPSERRQGFDYWKALECSHDYNNMAYYEGDSPEIKYWDGYSPFAVCKDAESYIENHAENSKPFFLFVALATPHFPHHSAPEEFTALYPDEKLQLNPNVPEEIHAKVKEELRGYYAHCTATDQAIGGIFDKIEELKLSEKTVIVFTSDHGEIMGAHGIRIKQKQVPFIESAGVPMIVKYPMAKHRIIEMPITTPDISTSLLSMAGINVPDSFEGEDFGGWLKKGKGWEKDNGVLYMSVAPFALVKPEYKKEYRAIKTERYTYVKDISGPWLLFDDTEDPYQMNNLIDKPGYEELQLRMDKKLKQEMKNKGVYFNTAEEHINEWGFKVNKGGYIPYDRFDVEPQAPKRNIK